MSAVFSVTAAVWVRWRAALPFALVAVLAGCSVPAAPAVSGPVSAALGVPVVLRFGDQAAAARLTDTPPARQLAAMLPLTVHMKDVWRQAKSGRLPWELAIQGSSTTHDPARGEIYFWPHTEVVAVYYDDPSQAVPAPGLVRIGVVDTGIENLANACEGVTVRIDLAPAANS